MKVTLMMDNFMERVKLFTKIKKVTKEIGLKTNVLVLDSHL